MPENYLKPLAGKVKPRPFAVFDIETTIHLEQAFLLGFYDGVQYNVFEDRRKNISQPHLPESARGPISQFLTWLFSTKRFCQYWIYAHNGGNFDFLYLIRWLMEHTTEYSFNVVPLQSSILCLEVSDKPELPRKTPRTWTFLDSYRLMNAPLEKLGQALVGESKVKEPPPIELGDGWWFVHPITGVAKGPYKDKQKALHAQNHMFYATLHRNPRRYAYQEQDCRLLFNCLETFYGMVQNMGGEIGMTAPSSAMKSFRRMHLDKWIPINSCFPGCDCE